MPPTTRTSPLLAAAPALDCGLYALITRGRGLVIEVFDLGHATARAEH